MKVMQIAPRVPEATRFVAICMIAPVRQLDPRSGHQRRQTLAQQGHRVEVLVQQLLTHDPRHPGVA